MHGRRGRTSQVIERLSASYAACRQTAQLSNSSATARQQLGFGGNNEAWSSRIRSSIALAESIEELAPDLAQDGPNPEYPWPRANPAVVPAEHEFDIWLKLRDTANGRHFLHFLRSLLEGQKPISDEEVTIVAGPASASGPIRPGRQSGVRRSSGGSIFGKKSRPGKNAIQRPRKSRVADLFRAT